MAKAFFNIRWVNAGHSDAMEDDIDDHQDEKDSEKTEEQETVTNQAKVGKGRCIWSQGKACFGNSSFSFC
jgi:hypothetical protein